MRKSLLIVFGIFLLFFSQYQLAMQGKTGLGIDQYRVFEHTVTYPATSMTYDVTTVVVTPIETATFIMSYTERKIATKIVDYVYHPHTVEFTNNWCEGRLVTDAGVPISNAPVHVYGTDERKFVAVTDANGKFVCFPGYALVGVKEIKFEPDQESRYFGCALFGSWTPTTIAIWEFTESYLTPTLIDRKTFTGLLLTTQGMPVANRTVYVDWRRSDSLAVGSLSAVTDADGKFVAVMESQGSKHLFSQARFEGDFQFAPVTVSILRSLSPAQLSFFSELAVLGMLQVTGYDGWMLRLNPVWALLFLMACFCIGYEAYSRKFGG